MSVWMYIVGAIILLIALILSMKINVTVSYKDSIKVSLRILFINIRLFPKKDKLAKEPKKKKKKKEKKAPPPIPDTEEEEKGPSIVKIIWEIRETVLDLSGKCMGALHFKFARLNIEVGCEDATKTALVYGTVTQSVAYLLEYLDNISNVEVSRFSQINIQSNFISRKSKAEAKITLYIRVISGIKLLFSALKAYLIFKYKKERLTEEQNGKNKSE